MHFTVVKLYLQQMTWTDYFRTLARTERNNTQMT